MIQTAYRANDTPPVNKYELLNEYWAGEVVPSESLVHPIECKPQEGVLSSLFIRDSSTTDSLNFYDLGVTTVAVQGQQTGGGVLGDLWITYEVELRKPKMYAALGRAAVSLNSGNLTSNVLRMFTGSSISFSSFSGTVVITSPADNLHRITIPPGNAGTYLVVITVSNMSSSSGSASIAFSNATAITNATESSAIASTTMQASIPRFTLVHAFSINDPTLVSTWTLTGVTFAASGNYNCDVTITSYDADTSTYN